MYKLAKGYSDVPNKSHLVIIHFSTFPVNLYLRNQALGLICLVAVVLTPALRHCRLCGQGQVAVGSSE